MCVEFEHKIMFGILYEWPWRFEWLWACETYFLHIDYRGLFLDNKITSALWSTSFREPTVNIRLPGSNSKQMDREKMLPTNLFCYTQNVCGNVVINCIRRVIFAVIIELCRKFETISYIPLKIHNYHGENPSAFSGSFIWRKTEQCVLNATTHG